MRYEGTAKLDKRTKDLVKRLGPNDIAVIDHIDMDRVSAETLLSSGVEVVVNAAPSISGAYPNIGPLLLTRGGVQILDHVGEDVFDKLSEGDHIVIQGDKLFRDGELVATGTRLSVDSVEAALELASDQIGVRLDEFARNTIEYLNKERDLLASSMWVPDVKTDLHGRHALVVVRGYDFREDIDTLKPYIREVRPVLIGVDGGADALIDAGFKPDIIVGDMDSVTDRALTSGAELIVHAYADGRAPGLERLNDLGVGSTAFVWPLSATSEDLALLLPWEKGADLIVAVGTHVNLVEYLDKGRKGMASTFLVRQKVGPKLVDAKGVSKLYRSSASTAEMLPIVFAAILVIVALFVASPGARTMFTLLVLQIRTALGI